MKLRTIVAGGVAGWLGWRLLGPEISPRFAPPQEHPFPVPGRTIFVGRKEYMIRETGLADAHPVVLIHGWVYESVVTWHRLVPYLADRYRVIMIDQRNHGGSVRIRRSYEIEDVADEVAAVLDSLDLEQATVIGYSMGGMVTLALARRHPTKVKNMVLGATAAHPVRNRYLVGVLFWLMRGLWRIGKVEGARVSMAIFGKEAVQKRHYSWLWDRMLDRDPHITYLAGHAIIRFDARPWIGQLEQPTLVVIATEDQVLRTSYQYEMASQLRDPEILELHHARHEAVLSHATEIGEAVVEFIEKHE